MGYTIVTKDADFRQRRFSSVRVRKWFGLDRARSNRLGLPKNKRSLGWVAMRFDEIRTMVLALDGVEEGTSYGTPAFKVNGALIARLRDDIGALVLRMSIEDRAELMAADPETYFITDHYLKYPWILGGGLARVHPDAMLDLLRSAWRSAAAGRGRDQGVARGRGRPPHGDAKPIAPVQ